MPIEGETQIESTKTLARVAVSSAATSIQIFPLKFKLCHSFQTQKSHVESKRKRKKEKRLKDNNNGKKDNAILCVLRWYNPAICLLDVCMGIRVCLYVGVTCVRHTWTLLYLSVSLCVFTYQPCTWHSLLLTQNTLAIFSRSFDVDVFSLFQWFALSSPSLFCFVFANFYWHSR